MSIILIIGILSFEVVSLALLCINGFYFGAALEYSVNSIGIGKTKIIEAKSIIIAIINIPHKYKLFIIIIRII